MTDPWSNDHEPAGPQIINALAVAAGLLAFAVEDGEPLTDADLRAVSANVDRAVAMVRAATVGRLPLDEVPPNG